MSIGLDVGTASALNELYTLLDGNLVISLYSSTWLQAWLDICINSVKGQKSPLTFRSIVCFNPQPEASNPLSSWEGFLTLCLQDEAYRVEEDLSRVCQNTMSHWLDPPIHHNRHKHKPRCAELGFIYRAKLLSQLELAQVVTLDKDRYRPACWCVNRIATLKPLWTVTCHM